MGVPYLRRAPDRPGRRGPSQGRGAPRRCPPVPVRTCPVLRPDGDRTARPWWWGASKAVVGLGGVARAPTGQPARVIRQGDVHALPSCDRSSPAGRSAFLLPPIAIGEDLGAKGIEGENTPAGDGGVIRAKDRPPLGELVSPQEPTIGDAAHRAGARCFVPSMPSQVAGEALARTPLGLRVAARTRAACSRRTHHVMGFP